MLLCMHVYASAFDVSPKPMDVKSLESADGGERHYIINVLMLFVIKEAADEKSAVHACVGR